MCLANLTAFCDEMTSSVDEGKSVGVICLDFRKAFSTNSQPCSQMREAVNGWIYEKLRGALARPPDPKGLPFG